MQELADLERAASGSTADKIRYFDNCIRRRMADLRTPPPAEGVPFSWEQKRKLSLACSRLKEGHCYALIEIVAQCSAVAGPADKEGEGEILVELDQLPDATLLEMQVCGAALAMVVPGGPVLATSARGTSWNGRR
jgi:Bromodomain extra-terminal - transcription regulation